MEQADGLQVVLGAGGGTGRAIVDELMAQGRRVRAVSRRPLAAQPPGVEVLQADLSDPGDARHALEGASVVYHAAQPPYHQWQGNFERLNDAVARASAAIGARLVFADNLYMYGPGASPMTEASPQLASDAKGRLRIALAADLPSAIAGGGSRCRAVPDYFGPRGGNTGLANAFGGCGRQVRHWAGPDVALSSYLQDWPDDGRARRSREWLVVLAPAGHGSAHGRQFPNALRGPRRRPHPVDGPCPARGRLFIDRPQVGASSAVAAPFVSDWSAEASFGPSGAPLDVALGTTLGWWRATAG
jgi:hypothetical protein